VNIVGTNFPEGTHTVVIILRALNADRTVIARVHYYRRPDGSIAGSGLPDPLRLLHNGVKYTCHHGKRDFVDLILHYCRRCARWITHFGRNFPAMAAA